MQKPPLLACSAMILCCCIVNCTRVIAQSVDSADNLRRSYIDDDDQRRLADLQFRVDPKTGRSLRISIAATGPNVAPIGGFRGIQGSNRYTAEELDLVLRGLHESQVITTTASGDSIEGRIEAEFFGRLTERRVLANGELDFWHQTQLLPLTIQIVGQSDSLEWQRTTVIIDGQSRLTCRYRIQDGKIVDLQTQSLGHDGYIAQDGPGTKRKNQWLRAAAADAEAPVELKEWERRDLEGKWVLMTQQLERAPEKITQWVAWLVQQKQFELLEWLAIYQPDAFKSHGVGKALLEADAVQWIRVAAWHRNTSPYMGHGRQQATQMLLEASPAVVEHWLQTHQEELDNWEPGLSPLYGQLVADDVASVDSSRYTKPFQPDQLFDVLSSQTPVADFGDRLRAEDGVVYEHQILRAINGVIISGRRTETLKQQLRKLVDHPNQRVRIEALLAHSFLLPGTQAVRPSGLLEIVDNEKEPDAVRQAALLGVSYQIHPSLILKMHTIASQPSHPAWNSAVSRLGDIGKGYSALIFDSLPKQPLNAEQKHLLNDAVVRIAARELSTGTSGYDLAELLRLTAFAKAEGHTHASVIEDWVRTKAKTLKPNRLAILKKNYSAHQISSVVPIWEPPSDSDWQAEYSTLFDELTNKVVIQK